MQKFVLLTIIICCSVILFFTPTAYSNKGSKPVSSIQISSSQLVTTDSIDYEGFMKLTQDIDPYRQSRLVSIEEFAQMMTEENTIILDTRSKLAYDHIHIKGAVHLNFSDFTTDKLAQIIPNKKTRILIYCNNNFINAGVMLASKSAPLALNIPTFINLVGYGYEDVYELKNVISLNDARKHLEFERNSILTIGSDNPKK